MRVIVLARAPVPGRCKTRLVPALGAGGAAALQCRLARRTLETARRAGATVELWGTPDCRHGFFQAARGNFGILLRRQSTGNLGRRMQRALAHGPALLVGTDCPGLSPAHLKAAWRVLEKKDCVLQPSADGGYVLIGAHAMPPRALAGIQWSSGRELAQTRRRFARLGLAWAELPPLSDIDTPADYRRARRQGLI